MILYFDSYITDIPYPGKPLAKPKNDYRGRVRAYNLPSRLEISKYALSSYAIFPWSNVFIKYQIDDAEQRIDFENFCRKLFPKAVLISNRSATQSEYVKSLEALEKMEDAWICYCPNNDHILMISEESSIDYMQRLIRIADSYLSKYPLVSIAYSHFSEYINFTNPSSLNYGSLGNDFQILEDNEFAQVILKNDGDFNSVQIVNKNIFRHWFLSKDLGNQRVVRAEDLIGKIEGKPQVVVIPKQQLMFHFEGYEHMLGGLHEIRVDQIPSLFIPIGFFENDLKIAYGYDDYRPGWVNINPAAKNYCFDDPVHGTDLKIGLQDIPLFWKSRISKIDENTNADRQSLTMGREKQLSVVKYPWSLKNQGLNIKTLRFRVKRPLLRFYPIANKLRLLPTLKKLKRIFRFY